MSVNFFATAGFNRHTGYGKLEHGIVRGLDDIGVEVVPFGMINPDDYAVMPAALREKLSTRSASSPITIVSALPGNCMGGWHAIGKKVWLYTMSESDRVSQEWVETINSHCAGVFVPAPALVKIYRESGVRVPVHDVGMGVDYALPPLPQPLPMTAQAPIERGAKDKFIFLTYSYGDMRKGAHKAVLSFNLLFGGNPHFELWIKARDIKYTWLEGCQDEQIRVIDEAMDEAQWFELLGKADCFLFPSYGEGFGLPPREAVLAGVPTIATRALGMADVDCWGYPIDVLRWLPAQFDAWEANAEGAHWADPDQSDLQQRMAWVVGNQQEARAFTLKGREYLLQHFTWKRTAERMMEVLRDHYNTAN